MRLGIVAAVALLSIGCSASGKSEQEIVKSNPGLSPPTMTDQPSTEPLPPEQPAQNEVSVALTLQVSEGPQTRAFKAYLRARAESLNAGIASPALARLSTARELARQRAVITSAFEQGFVVPRRPRAAVVSLARLANDRAALGVCFYLPSTEYRNRITGGSPYGDVPKRWQPAVVGLTRSRVTWKVDRLDQPTERQIPDCRGLS